MPQATMMQIGELARRTGVSTRSLRYYEQQGLLAPSRNENGYRLYDRSAVTRAENIKDLFAIGLISEDVRHYIENGCLDRPLAEAPPCRAELDTVQQRLEGLDARIARLQRVRDRLASHSTALERTIAAERSG